MNHNEEVPDFLGGLGDMLPADVAMVGISNAFDFGIDDEDVAIAVNKDILALCKRQSRAAGNDIPDEETAVGEATLAARFLETEGGHVGVNHNLCGGGGVGYANLTENGLHGATVEACKAVELVGSVGEKHIVHQHLFEQCHDAAAVHQVVDLVNGIVGHVDIILVAAGARNAEAEHLHHRNPVASGLGHLLGHALLPLKGCYMRLASSRLRFM